MKKTISLVLVFLSFSINAGQNKICDTSNMEQVIWQKVAPNPIVSRGLELLLHQIGFQAELKQVRNVLTQFVRGNETHYAIEFEVENGDVWSGVVFDNHRGELMVEQSVRNRELCPPSISAIAN
ncbi:hypothetical protein [Vibrio sagamiensis]|uniref:PepSY domain-containing protein n=1 Tax=Vibrio sagamiensis NBRC 104589 TaxID=1219064 RepID=A0A511QD29_9VIBR|nr:hypothetical protein [Vibrio sagamiensis]GEM75201.1 hypothetical protein VSA01S_13130 [Vibrio sagamiensis NBRC 104589]